MREDAEPSAKKLLISERCLALPQDRGGFVRRTSIDAKNRPIANLAYRFEIATSEPAVGKINQDDATVRVRASPYFGDKACHRLHSPKKILMECWKLPKAIETAGGKLRKTRSRHLALARLDD